MAVVQNPIVGKASGSVGNITFAGWKGKNIMKTKAENSYSNPTQSQLNNNEKFAVMIAFYRTISSIVLSGFKAMAIGKSEYNAFMQENPYSDVVEGTPGAYLVSTELLKVAKGPELISALGTVEKAASGANSIEITWSDTTSLAPTTPLVAVAFNRTTGSFIVANYADFDQGITTVDATGIGTAIATTDVYLFYCNLVTGKACDSILVPTA